MPDLEVIINYGRRVNTHLPLPRLEKRKKNFTIRVQLLGCHGNGDSFLSFVEQQQSVVTSGEKLGFHDSFQVNIIYLLTAGLIIFHWVALQVSPQ